MTNNPIKPMYPNNPIKPMYPKNPIKPINPMNPKKSFQPGLSRFFLTFVCGSLLTALPATAQITIVNADNTTFTNVVPDIGTPGPNNLEANPWTVSFNAGATANKLIVTLSSETGTTGGPPSITYNGVALTRVPGTVNQRSFGIWYLDNPFTGGPANLVIDMTSYNTVNGIGFGVVSVSGAAPGSSGGNSASGTEVTLTTRVANSLIVSNYTSNAVATPTVPSGYTQLYTSNDIGSAQGAAAYLNSVAAGPQTVTYAQVGTLNGHSTAAAAFVPASAAPVLVNVSPADNAINVAIGANLVANFSEPVVAGTGNVELWQVGGSFPVESFDVASSLSGQTLTINPTANLTPGGEYYVLIPATALVDTSGGDPFAGFLNPSGWNFTADARPPITFLNSENFINTTTLLAPQTYTKEFDPDDAADALVVILATEVAVTNTFDVTWDGVPMLPVNSPNSNNPVSVFLLNNPTNVGLADLNVTVSSSASGANVNGFGMTVMALSNVGNFPIAPTAFLNRGGANSVLPINLNVDGDGSFVVAGFNSSDGNPVGGGITASANLTQLQTADFGNLQGYFGYDEGVPAGINTYQFTYAGTTTFASAVAFAAVLPPTNTFANWIGTFSGLGGLTAVGDDPDRDGTGNGVENFFGTNPGTFTQGLLVGVKSGNLFTFTHPQSATPASDLTASYRWSKDLANFLADGATDGALTKVDFTTQANFPSPGITTVTATVTGTAASKLFVRVNVTQP